MIILDSSLVFTNLNIRYMFVKGICLFFTLNTIWKHCQISQFQVPILRFLTSASLFTSSKTCISYRKFGRIPESCLCAYLVNCTVIWVINYKWCDYSFARFSYTYLFSVLQNLRPDDHFRDLHVHNRLIAGVPNFADDRDDRRGDSEDQKKKESKGAGAKWGTADSAHAKGRWWQISPFCMTITRLDTWFVDRFINSHVLADLIIFAIL